MSRRPVHFVLDHNFPWQVTGLEWPAYITITTLQHLDPRLIKDHEDWEVIRALAERGDVDGYVTNDAEMLKLPEEMVALTDVRFALVVTDGVGGNAIRATALVMLHLEEIAAQLTGTPAIFVLRPRELGRDRTTPHRVLNSIAAHLGVTPPELIVQKRTEMALQTERRRRSEAEQAPELPPDAPAQQTRTRRRPGREPSGHTRRASPGRPPGPSAGGAPRSPVF